ncbi:MAG: hypothetical protein WEB19_04600 [Acidimicrobiia bacterium]
MMLEEPVLRQLAWHLGLASRYAATDQIDLARTETLIAWAVLTSADGFEIDEMTAVDTAVDLGDPGAGNGRLLAAFEDARDGALALIGHFTSEQRFDLVDVYEQVLGVVEDVIARLADRATGNNRREAQ